MQQYHDDLTYHEQQNWNCWKSNYVIFSLQVKDHTFLPLPNPTNNPTH
jgi:hypothetical protein